MGTIRIVSPVSQPRIEEQPLALRSVDLTGLTIGLLDNQKANARRLLDRVGDALQIHAGVYLVREQKIATSPAPEAVMGRLQRCDAVVLAIAD
jgi:hypothetical protein